MQNASLRDLFHKPQTKEAGGVSFRFYKLPFELFDDAIALGEWLGADKFSLERLREAARRESPVRQQLLTVVAGCLKLADTDDFLQPADVAVMPVPMLAEVLIVLLEENADFFTQTLPNLTETLVRLGSIGSALLSSSLAPVTDQNASPATASPK